RSIDLDYRTGGTSGGTPPPAPGPVVPETPATQQPPAPAPQQPLSSPIPAPPSLAQIAAAGAPASAADAVKKVAKVKKLVVARGVRTKSGQRVLKVRVTSPNKPARIKIKVGKRTVVRRVKTNRLVTVAGVSLPKGQKVKVTLG